jgi:hypothetical protein
MIWKLFTFTAVSAEHPNLSIKFEELDCYV